VRNSVLHNNNGHIEFVRGYISVSKYLDSGIFGDKISGSSWG